METQTDNSAFQIKTNSFEGPFGLLLSLIEKRKLHINDVSLSAVTEDFLNFMNKLGGLHYSEISSFVSVAASLLLIKSKSLLPNLDLTNEEEGDIKNLEERLRLYELFTKLGGNIKNNFGQKIIFAPLERKNNVLVFLPDDRITKDSMMIFARNAVGAMPQKVFLPKVEVQKVISLEEMIDKLTERIKSSLKMNFKDFSGGGKQASREEKIVVIVGFLAMLELIRNGILDAIQETEGGDIIMTKQEKIMQEISETAS
ncbi:MAG: segregation/condensation protein A [Candidatus Pacebacteria bacterium]|nr:segregation/condensation protein A [Candidatus Paceibacterota bacterium]